MFLKKSNAEYSVSQFWVVEFLGKLLHKNFDTPCLHEMSLKCVYFYTKTIGCLKINVS